MGARESDLIFSEPPLHLDRRASWDGPGLSRAKQNRVLAILLR